MKYKNISELVAKIKDNAESHYIDKSKSNGDVSQYNQREVLSRINHYINSLYVDRNDEALFWNIVNSRRIHFSKLIGVDTKDFMPYGQGTYNFVQAWSLRKELRAWFDDNQFYKILNEVSEGVATYGSIVWKKYKDGEKVELEEVDLENLYFDQTAKCIDDVDVVEMHYLSEAELWEKNEVWDKVPDIIKKGANKDGKFEIWEILGWYSEDDGVKPVKKHSIGYGSGSSELICFEEEVDEDFRLYFDFHLGRYTGRWMRVGVVERLFKLQEQANRLVNQNAQYNEIASLLLLRSATPDASGNVLTQLENGEIIDDPTLEQVQLHNTGFQAFVSQLQQIENQADKICLQPDVIQGEMGPSGTPFRSTALAQSAAQGAFTSFKQDLGEKIGYIIMTEILPELTKKWNRGVIIDIMEDDSDIEMYDESLVRVMKKEYLLNGNGLVTPEVEQQIKDQIENDIKRIGRKVVMDKGWINFKYGIKMMPTSETVDKNIQNDVMFNSLQMIGGNPALLNIPMFKQYLENNGISWWKLTPKDVQNIQQSATGSNVMQQVKPENVMGQAQPKSL